jgi:hypothetical protein
VKCLRNFNYFNYFNFLNSESMPGGSTGALEVAQRLKKLK